MSTLVFVNGQPQNNLPATDRGLQYGDGVFETIRLLDGTPVLWAEHSRRLLSSCHRLGIDCDPQLLESYLVHALTMAQSRDSKNYCGILKIIVTRGDGGRGYQPAALAESRLIFQLHPYPDNYAALAEAGINCLLCKHPVSINAALAGMKHLNRLDQVMASQELASWQQRPGVHEGLMTDGYGTLIEGTRSNVFLMLQGRLCTPELRTAGVAGVMRDWLLDKYLQEGVAADVRQIHVAELSVASEVFICNSVLGVWPVRKLVMGREQGSDIIEFKTQEMARQAQVWSKQLLGL